MLFILPVHAEYSSSITDYSIEQNDAKLSPDGKHMALAILKDGQRVLFILETDSRKSVSGVNLGDDQDVGNFLWATNERVVLEVLHREAWDDTPKFHGELYAVDIDGSERELLVGYRVDEAQVGSKIKSRKAVYGWSRVVSMLPDQKNKILISTANLPGGSLYFTDPLKRKQMRATDIKELQSTVHEIHIKSGKMSGKITHSPEPNTQFITDEKGELRYAYGGTPEKGIKLFKYVDKEWQTLNLGKSADFLPLAFSKNLQRVTFIDSIGADKKCLFSHDFALAVTKKLNTSCGLDKSQLRLTVDKTDVYSIEDITGKSPTYETVNTDSIEADFFAQITGVFEGSSVRINSHSDDYNYWLIRTQRPEQPVSFYLYSRKLNEFKQIM
jgi:hypothetical protein